MKTVTTIPQVAQKLHAMIWMIDPTWICHRRSMKCCRSSSALSEGFGAGRKCIKKPCATSNPRMTTTADQVKAFATPLSISTCLIIVDLRMLTPEQKCGLGPCGQAYED